MSHYIVDRRPNGNGKSTPNRKKLLDRVKGSVKKTVKEAVQNGNIADIVKGGNKVRVPVKDLREPSIGHGEGGVTERTIPGNNQKGRNFNTGDTIARPPKGGGQGPGGGAGNSGDGNDDFVFELTRDEFLEFFFEDLELPDLAQKKLAVTEEKKPMRNGFARDGNPAALDLMQTMKSSISRRAALRTPKKKKLRELEAALAVAVAEMEAYYADPILMHAEPGLGGLMAAAIETQEKEIAELKRKIKHVPYVDDIDLRYRNWTQKPIPATQAVMFCLMDVSGSMSSWHKDIAKRFYMLLYLFLYKNYEKVEIVFVRHHHSADEVDEQTFFYDRASGGTIVSEGLKLVNKIIDDRYDKAKWNVYVAQASDGDNWQSDHEQTMIELNKILSKVQFYFYIDINQYSQSDMFTLYKEQVTAENFAQERISDVTEIYGVFRKLFEAR